ncbi:MAG: RHS repeat-associated core domain-containing protein, partial [Burkholderiales bacterium]
TSTVGANTNTYSYGAASNRLTSLQAQTGASRAYTYDANGSTINDGINQYLYDARGRMIGAVSAQQVFTYEYNALGQRITKDSPRVQSMPGDVNGDGVFSLADVVELTRMLQGKTPPNPAADCDGDGQVTRKDIPCVVRQLGRRITKDSPRVQPMPGDVNGDGVFSSADVVELTRMLLGKTPPNAAADCDGDGQVTRKDIPCVVRQLGRHSTTQTTISTTPVLTHYFYDLNGRLIGEFDDTGALARAYIWLGDTPVALLTAAGLLDPLYIHADHLNTPRVITDQNQRVVWRWDNTEPFGTNVADEDPDGDGTKVTCNLRFPGQYFDKETGNHYNYFRDYDPAIGRYIEADPVGITTTSRPTPTTRLNHLFGYVDSNPLSWVDPLGLVKWFGQSKSFNWLAYGREEYELESECKCGVKARIKVLVDSLGPGFGASSTRSTTEFEDHFACPNPMAFAGPAVTFSGTIAVRFGTSYSRTQLGAARSSGGWSAVEGLGASIGVNFGNARVPVEDIRFENCPCEKK